VASSLVERMVVLIHEGLSGIVTLRMLGQAIGRQPGYLGSLFQRELRMSVRDYTTRVRMQRAEELIREGLKIEAVALTVGYRSKKNFYRQFKRRFGTTPERYRRGFRNNRPGRKNRQVNGT
jgi:two-component system response regulator YesN